MCVEKSLLWQQSPAGTKHNTTPSFEPEPERMRGKLPCKDKSSLIPNYPHIGGWLNHG